MTSGRPPPEAEGTCPRAVRLISTSGCASSTTGGAALTFRVPFTNGGPALLTGAFRREFQRTARDPRVDRIFLGRGCQRPILQPCDHHTPGDQGPVPAGGPAYLDFFKSIAVSGQDRSAASFQAHLFTDTEALAFSSWKDGNLQSSGVPGDS